MDGFKRRTVLTGAGGLGVAILPAVSSEGGRAASNHEWEVDTDGWVVASPTVVEGYVYVGDSGGTLYKLDADSGDSEWSTSVGASINRAVAVEDGTVYVGNGDGSVYALDTEDGGETWERELGGSVLTSPTAANGLVYASNGEAVFALDAEEGGEEWSVETEWEEGDGVWGSSPTVVDGRVYIGSLDAHVYALDADTGEEVWSVETDGEVESSPTVAGELVYVGSDDNTVYALDAEDGTEEWTFDTDGGVFSSPTVADGTVYVGSEDDFLYALDAEDGTERWSSEHFVSITTGPTVVDDHYFVAAPPFVTHGTDEGALILRETEAQFAFSSPVVVDGTLYVGFGYAQDGDASGRVYAVDAPVDGSSTDSRVRLGTLGHHDDWASAPAARYLEVSIAGTGVQGGEILGEVTIENRGTLSLERDVTYIVDGGRIDATTHALASGETGSIDFNYVIERGDAPSVDIAFESEHDSDTVTVELAPARLGVDIGDVGTPLEAGAELSVTATVENEGDEPASQQVDLLVGGESVDSGFINLDGGGRTEVTFTWETADGDEGEVDLTVTAGDAEATESVTVTAAQEEPQESDGSDEGSDDGGDAGGDGDDSDEGTTDGDGSDGSGSGLGVGSALAGLGAVGYLLKRRLGSQRGEE